ncbi:hypothetical protein ACFFLS_11910 [Flavobacterium procerum]|uniref:IS6 family transposase n=1 Tax=Flavobacterium procerum TaxID=1455569 RepID=A0ABV6BQN5_9FLAO
MNTTGRCYPKAIILRPVYLKLRFRLSYRDVKEIMTMHGIEVDRATIQRWVFKFALLIELELNSTWIITFSFHFNEDK